MREHYADCRAVCDWEDLDDRFRAAFLRCPNDHEDHDCNCSDIAASRGEREAEAAAEQLAELDGSHAG